ncbi:MAG TPA: hypothetical protein DCQ31_07405 [Bacteroidales bacterium]|nr:hypothetical protein [Bacteroidales bacterium]
MEIDTLIIEFIKKHHVLTLATSVNNQPWCANCYYAYLENENAFVFSTDYATRHGKEALENSLVAASIVLETKIVGKIQGIQLTGVMFVPEGEYKAKAEKRYLKKYPFARLMETNLWVLEPNFYKLTDNRLGFGKKLLWKKEA